MKRLREKRGRRKAPPPLNKKDFSLKYGAPGGFPDAGRDWFSFAIYDLKNRFRVLVFCIAWMFDGPVKPDLR